jgi:NADP-dependent 3-hydroxy acid dehydrogenase YdfG
LGNAFEQSACRSVLHGQQVIEEIAPQGSMKLDCIALDLCSRASVQSFIQVFRAKYDSLDILVNNAV